MLVCMFILLELFLLHAVHCNNFNLRKVFSIFKWKTYGSTHWTTWILHPAHCIFHLRYLCNTNLNVFLLCFYCQIIMYGFSVTTFCSEKYRCHHIMFAFKTYTVWPKKKWRLHNNFFILDYSDLVLRYLVCNPIPLILMCKSQM